MQERKLSEDYSEEELKEMWKWLFLWVVDNRIEWFIEIIREKKMLLKIEQKG